jgi:nucleoside-diphosphate-sugar epimerase
VFKSLRHLTWRQAAPRIVADMLIVQFSMLAAIAVSVFYQTSIGRPAEAAKLIGNFRGYYFTFLWLFSPLILIVFLLSGFYSQSRSYEMKYKALVLFRGVATATVCFLTANLLFLRISPGRSVVVSFLLFAGGGVVMARVGTHAVLQYFPAESVTVKPSSKPSKTVLVVGGAGYIGSLLVRRLLERGDTVRVLDGLVYGDGPLQGVLQHPNLELIVGDCRNIRDVVASMEGVGAVVNLAAIVGDPACEQDRRTALEINYAATRMMIEIAKGRDARRFVFASSCSVYGATDIEVDERSETAPISVYARTKIDSETALLQSTTETFSPVILRFATVFGLSPRPRFDLVVNLLTAKAWRDGVITIYNGQQWRPFIHVSDTVEALLRALDAPAGLVAGEIFNVGDSRLNYTLSDVAEKILAAFPQTQIERVENSDRRNYRVSFDKVRNRLNFKAKYTLEDGIQELKKAFEEGVVTDYKDIHYHNQRYLEAVGSPANKHDLDAQVMAAFGGEPGARTAQA